MTDDRIGSRPCGGRVPIVEAPAIPAADRAEFPGESRLAGPLEEGAGSAAGQARFRFGAIDGDPGYVQRDERAHEQVRGQAKAGEGERHQRDSVPPESGMGDEDAQREEKEPSHTGVRRLDHRKQEHVREEQGDRDAAGRGHEPRRARVKSGGRRGGFTVSPPLLSAKKER